MTVDELFDVLREDEQLACSLVTALLQGGHILGEPFLKHAGTAVTYSLGRAGLAAAAHWCNKYCCFPMSEGDVEKAIDEYRKRHPVA